MTENHNDTAPAGNAGEGIKPAAGSRFSAPLQGISVQDKKGGSVARIGGLLLVAACLGGGYYAVNTFLATDSGMTPPVNIAANNEIVSTPISGEAPAGTPIESPVAEAVSVETPAVEAPAVTETASEESAATTDTTVVPAESATAPVEPVVGAAAATPPADLPVPAGAAEPSAAEVAIVQNAAVLDSLASPPVVTEAAPVPADAGAITANSAANPAMPPVEQEAVIRPLPKEYLIVKKNHDAGDMDSRLTAARLALTQNRNAAALQLFNELHRDNPRDRRVLMGRAVSLQRLGQQSEALSAYEQVLGEDPKNLEALTNMLGLLKAQDPALAVEKLAELREAYPYNADITAQLGIAYAAKGSYEDATRTLDIAEALKPGSAYVLYNKAVLFDKMGRRTEAAQLYREIVRMSAEGQLDQPLPIDVIKRRLAVIR